MDPQIKQLIIWLVSAIAIIGLLWLAYSLLMKTAIGKGLNQFLGGVGAVLGAVGAQLTTCANSGFFNVDKGCWLGFAGLGIGIIYAGANVFGFFWKNPRQTGSDNARLRGESDADYAKRFGKELGEMKNGDGVGLNGLPESKVNDAAVRKVAIRKEANDYNKTLDQSDLSPNEIAQKRAGAKARYNAENAAINEELNEDGDNDVTDADDTADGFEPEPVFE